MIYNHWLTLIASREFKKLTAELHSDIAKLIASFGPDKPASIIILDEVFRFVEKYSKSKKAIKTSTQWKFKWENKQTYASGFYSNSYAVMSVEIINSNDCGYYFSINIPNVLNPTKK